jgi:ribonuclease M5
MSYQQVIVVEGYHDEQKIKSVYPDIECIVTNGSEISRETLNLIYETSLLKEVILFLDPDYPGKRITQKIMETQGKFKIAYIDKEKALNNSKTKVGIEHAKNKDIIEALERLLTIEYNLKTVVRNDIYVRNLIDNTNSKELRKFVCQKLNIPFCNGKTFLKYLNLLSIDLERIDQIINEKQS